MINNYKKGRFKILTELTAFNSYTYTLTYLIPDNFIQSSEGENIIYQYCEINQINALFNLNYEY